MLFLLLQIGIFLGGVSMERGGPYLSSSTMSTKIIRTGGSCSKGNSCLTKLLEGLNCEKIRKIMSYNNSPPYMMARWLPQQIPSLNFLGYNSHAILSYSGPWGTLWSRNVTCWSPWNHMRYQCCSSCGTIKQCGGFYRILMTENGGQVICQLTFIDKWSLFTIFCRFKDCEEFCETRVRRHGLLRNHMSCPCCSILGTSSSVGDFIACKRQTMELR